MRHFTLFLVLLFSSFAFAQSNLSQGLFACYPFSGNPADQAGGHNGVLHGGTLATDRFGSAGAAYYFSDSAFIEVPTFSQFAADTALSISFWAKADALGGFAVLLYPDNPSNRLGVSLYYSHNGTSSIFWDCGDIYSSGRSYVLPYPFNSAWEHYVFTSSQLNGTMNIYKNGALLHTEAHSSPLSVAGRKLRIGGTGDNNYSFNGTLDDVRIYSRELSSAEISQLYTLNNGCDIQTGIAETTLENISLYPNPTTGQLHIEVKSAYPLVIYDVQGKSVFESNADLTSLDVDMSMWQAGVYVVKTMDAAGQSRYAKIVKQ